jgi:hypothetical protein
LATGLAESGQNSLLNQLLATDWHDYDSLKFLEDFADASLNLNEVDTANLEEFITTCQKAGLAIQKLDLETL